MVDMNTENQPVILVVDDITTNIILMQRMLLRRNY